MHKKTLFEFHEAATNRAANDFAYGDHEQGVIPQDLLLDLLEKYNWPIDDMLLHSEERLFLDELGKVVVQKVAKLRTVDQQR